MDVSFKSTWDLLKSSARTDPSSDLEPVFGSIESVPMVRSKDQLLDMTNYILPTKLSEGSGATPALLSDRFLSPEVILTVKRKPSFHDEVLRAMKVAPCGQGPAVSLRAIARRTALVSTMRDREDFAKASRAEIISGNFPAYKTCTWHFWRAGDLCILLQVETEADFILVLVLQHVRRHGSAQSMELLCIPIQEEAQSGGDMCAIHFERAKRAEVSDFALARHESASRVLPISPVVPSFGRLKDGRIYFVDHILLYSDGFSQYNFKQGSAGGVYSISLNYPPAFRRSRERVRILALTPPGVSTMEGIRSIIDDLVRSSTVGVEVRNADDDDMILFTNIVGYVADYHETGHALDVTGQCGNAPCHLCAFHCYQGHAASASRYANSTVIHSSDICYARTGSRTEAIRASRVSDQDLVTNGLNAREQASNKNSPLAELSSKLKNAASNTEIPLTENDISVVNPRFDPYRSVLVSPDHFLFGVATNALNFAFLSLPSNARKKQVDALISTSLQLNGIANESEIFNFNASSVHAAGISSRFATLLISPEIFKEVCDSCKRCREIPTTNCDLSSSIANMTKLRNLVSATYWYPNIEHDGAEAVRRFNVNEGRSHLATLERMCEHYIQSLNNICKESSEAWAEPDKPNVHSVLELYKHSLPSMGHVQHFAGLVFEAAHQPLKRAMLRSNFRDSHLQSSETCIADDWKRRLRTLLMGSVDAGDRNTDERQIARLFCSSNPGVRDHISSDEELVRKTSSMVRSNALKILLNSSTTLLNNRPCSVKWLPSDPLKSTRNDAENDEELTNLLQVLDRIRLLEHEFFVQQDAATFQHYLKAERVKYNAFTKTQTNGHDIVYRGTVVRSTVEDALSPRLKPVPRKENQETIETLHFAIEMFATYRNDDNRGGLPSVLAVVRRCEETGQGLLKIDSAAPLQFLELDNCTRRVALTHACENDAACTCLESGSAPVDCHASILRGHRFYYYGRDAGYPPRMA